MISNTFKVGKYTCKLSIDETQKETGKTEAEWSPRLPSVMDPDMWDEYRAGRHALMLELSKAIGGSVVVTEL